MKKNVLIFCVLNVKFLSWIGHRCFICWRAREFALYEIFGRYVAYPLSVVDKLNEFLKNDIVWEYLRIAYQEQLFTGTGQYDIQLPVYSLTIIFEYISGEKFELVNFLYGKPVNNKIPFTTLIPFYCVDRDILQCCDI